MFLPLFLLFLLLPFSLPFTTTSSQLLSNVETNSYPIVFTTFTNAYTAPYYTLSFTHPFTNPPQVSTSFHTFKNCPVGSKTQYVSLQVAEGSQVITTVSARLQGYLYTNVDYNTSIQIIAYYIAYDPAENPNLHVQSKNTNLTIDYVDLTNLDLTSLSTFIACYPTRFIQLEAILVSFNYHTICTPVNKTRLQLAYQTTATWAAQAATAGIQLIRYTIIILQNTNSSTLIFTPGKVKEDNKSLTVNVGTFSSFFFIGLTDFEVSNGCARMGLKSDYRLTTDTWMHKITFLYFYVQYYFPKLERVSVSGFSDVVEIEFTAGRQFTVINMETLFNSTVSNTTTINDNIVTGVLSSKWDGTEVQMDTKIKNPIGVYEVSTSFKVIAAEYMNIDIDENTILIPIVNIDETVSDSNFILDPSTITMNKIDQSSTVPNNNKEITLDYNKDNIGQSFSIDYLSGDLNTKVKISLYLPTITRVQTSSFTKRSSLILSDIPSISSTVPSQYSKISSNINNQVFSPVSNNVVELNFDYEVSGVTSKIEIQFMTNLISQFKVKFSFSLITVQSLQYTVNSNTIKVTFLNTNNPTLSQFSTNNTQILPSSFLTPSQLLFSYSPSSLSTPFSITYSPSDSLTLFTSTNLQIRNRLTKLSVDIFSHWINFTLSNFQNLLPPNKPTITSPHTHLTIHSVEFNGTDIILSTYYNKTVDGMVYSINYDTDISTVYFDILTLQLVSDQPIVYCVSEFKNFSNQFYYASLVLVALYWSVFIVSVFLSQKIYGVEMMFALQLGYMSFIPTGVYCPPFTSLSVLRYSFGWNGIPFNVTQQTIYYYYSSLDIQSNFISNVNFMMYLLVLCPVVYGILYAVISTKYSDNLPIPSKLTSYSKSFLFDIPFTIILVNIPNICVSSVVNMQTFGVSSNIPSFIVNILMISLIFLYVILFLIFNRHFKQYRKQFCIQQQLCKISSATSTKLRRSYPLLLILQFTSISTILSIQSVFSYSLLITLVIAIFHSVLMIILSPYSTKLDNIRLFIHRIFIISIIGIQIGFKFIKEQNSSSMSIAYEYPWFVIVVLYILVIGLYLPYIVYKAVEKWARRKKVMEALEVKGGQGKNKEKRFFQGGKGDGKSYPATQFSIYQYKSKYKKEIGLLEGEKIMQNIKKQAGGGMKWEEMQIIDED